MNLKIGCCGFPVGKEKYYKEFNVVELQQTFYQIPKLETAKKWRESAPDDFEFTLKAWQLVTHETTSPTYRRLNMKIAEKKKSNYGFFKPTEEVFKAYENMREVAAALGAKIIVFQCPASFKPEKENIDNLKRFFKKVKRGDYKFVWEPRGNWTESIIEKLCKELELIHCVDPFKNERFYGDIVYYRLHGITGYRYKYTDFDLRKLIGFCCKKHLNYVMFNNTNMWEDARTFKELSKRF